MNGNTRIQENLRIPLARKRRSYMYDGMDALEVFRDVVRSYVIHQNGLG
jgi:hypothetical protein